MSIWLQHGFGKGDKIERLTAEGALNGLVLSAADEPPEALRAIARDALDAKIECWLDPQTYVYSIAQGAARCHDDHGLEFPHLDWSVDPEVIAKITKAVIKANRKVGTSAFVASAPLQRGLTDKWASLGMQFARVMARHVGDDNTIASVVVQESGLDRWPDVEEWLNSVTRLSVRGFYLVVARSAGTEYPSAWDKERFANLLRLIYRLRVLNEYDVTLGYSDVDGLCALAIGAQMASGWFYSQRRFQEAKWRPSTGGAPATPRFLSNRLLIPLRADEARDLVAADEEKWVAATAAQRVPLRGLYTIGDSRLQHLRALAGLSDEVLAVSSAKRLDLLEGKLTTAREQLQRLGRSALPRGLTYANQLTALISALALFRAAEGLGKKP